MPDANAFETTGDITEWLRLEGLKLVSPNQTQFPLTVDDSGTLSVKSSNIPTTYDSTLGALAAYTEGTSTVLDSSGRLRQLNTAATKGSSVDQTQTPDSQLGLLTDDWILVEPEINDYSRLVTTTKAYVDTEVAAYVDCTTTLFTGNESLSFSDGLPDGQELVFNHTTSHTLTISFTSDTINGDASLILSSPWHIRLKKVSADYKIIQSHPIDYTFGGSDLEPPYWSSGNAVVDKVTGTSFRVTVSGAFDNIAVTEYTVYDTSDDSVLGTSSSSVIQVIGLTTNTSYDYYVEAKDAAGNESTGGPTGTQATAATNVTDTFNSGELLDTALPLSWAGGSSLEINTSPSQAPVGLVTPGINAAVVAGDFIVLGSLKANDDTLFKVTVSLVLSQPIDGLEVDMEIVNGRPVALAGVGPHNGVANAGDGDNYEYLDNFSVTPSSVTHTLGNWDGTTFTSAQSNPTVTIRWNTPPAGTITFDFWSDKRWSGQDPDPGGFVTDDAVSNVRIEAVRAEE